VDCFVALAMTTLNPLFTKFYKQKNSDLITILGKWIKMCAKSSIIIALITEKQSLFYAKY
jgi:hypothetical protein